MKYATPIQYRVQRRCGSVHWNCASTYRELYDVVHGKDFISGSGPGGYRANVRTFIKRIRKKFRDVDLEFDQVRNYAGFGYQWIPG